MRRFLKSLKFIFMPHYWLMLNKYSKSFDKIVNDYFEVFEIEIVDTYTIKLGNLELWIENYPYSSLTEYGFFGGKGKIRPSRQTIWKRMKQVRKAQDDYLKTKYKANA